MPANAQICTRCILSATDDPHIRFNSAGVCNYCTGYDQLIKEKYTVSEKEKKIQLESIVKQIKEEGRGKAYDCIIGVSGGVDSTYVAFLAHRYGLRALIVHYDNGWNSELAVKNIENIISKLKFDLSTYVNDWEEFKDLQLSFFKASVVDIELITDQGLLAALYKTALKHNIKYILSGSNISTEAILPTNWYHWKTDVLNIEAIQKQFGTAKLKSYPVIGFWQRWKIDKFSQIKTISLLNYVDYVKEQAKAIIVRELGWRDYGGKHYESIFTRFYQSYYLPKKFGIDKRKAHLSTLICSGQMTREAALDEMKKPICDEQLMKEDKMFVLKKLGLTEGAFEAIMKLPVKQHTDYPSYLTSHYKYQALLSNFLAPLKRLFKR